MTPLALFQRRRSERDQAIRAWLPTKITSWRRRVGMSHHLVFGKCYLPSWMMNETPEFHWEIADMFRDLPRAAVAAPVGTAKTTTLTKLGALWSAFCEPDVQEILVVTSTGSLAATWLEQMGTAVKASEAIREDFGKVDGIHWSADHLEILPGWKPRCFIRALGIGEALRGRRPDRIILDDPESDALVNSETMRTQYAEWFWGALVNRLDTVNKKLTYIGTCLSEESLLTGLILSPRPGWVTRAYSMLDEESGKSIWEDKWPTEVLFQRREEIGEEAFQREFQNNPVRATFGNPFMLKSLVMKSLPLDRGHRLTVCLDPAFRAGGDAWAITVVEWLDDGTWHVREERKAKTGIEGMLDGVLSVRGAYPRMSAFGFEISGQQVGLEYVLSDLCKRKGIGLPLVPIKHSRVDKSKDERILALAHLINRGQVSFDPAILQCVAEMRGFRLGRSAKGQADDHLLDSLAMHMELNTPMRPKTPHVMTDEERRTARYRGVTYWRGRGTTQGVPGWYQS